MSPIHEFFNLSHAFSGALVLFAGLLAIIARKRKGLHTWAGLLYFIGMMWVCISAWICIVFFRFNLFLLVIGVFSFYLTFSGYRVLKRRQLGEQTWVDWAAAIISMLAGMGLIVFGLGMPYFLKGNFPIAYRALCVLFGWFTFKSAYDDIIIFRSQTMDAKMWWWYHHMQAMLGSYICAVTAFIVQSGHRILPDFGLPWLYWISPGIIGGIFIGRWIRSYKTKFGDPITKKLNKKLNLLVITSLLFVQFGYSQIYTQKQTRHRFAQLTLGVDYQTSIGATTQFLDEEKGIKSLDFPTTQAARLIVGGTHFWGHADFYVAFPVYQRVFESNHQEIAFTSGVETVFKYYPLRIEHHKIRPYIGISLSPYHFEQANNHLAFGNGTDRRMVRLPITTGLTFNYKNHLFEANLTYNYDNKIDYHLFRDVINEIETPPFFLSFSYKYMLDTTAGAEENWESGRTAKVTDILAERGDLDGFFAGVGMSSAWWIGNSEYNEEERPFLGNHRLAIMPDFALGYYWHKPDLSLSLTYRSYSSGIDAYGAVQTVSRQSLGLELTKSLFDYHGFTPFIGPVLSFERLSAKESFEGRLAFDESQEKLSYGITFGWDIRPNRIQWFTLRTNLRYYPDLSLGLDNGLAISFDNIEFNFIQFVFYPNRIF